MNAVQPRLTGAALALWLLLRAAAALAGQAEPFSLVVLPDTQIYSEKYPETYLAQTQWVKDNAQRENIRFVIHLGDIVQSRNKHEVEWQNADRAHQVLDGVVPYSVLPGNHDLGGEDKVPTRDSLLYNKYFPPARFQKYDWYGGHFGQDNQNNYCRFEAAGLKFLVLSLEYAPRDEVLAWAGQIAAAHPQHRVILATHCYMRPRGRDAKCGAGGFGNSGEAIWEKLVRKHPNVFLVLSGHVLGVGRQASTNDAGRPVHEILVDYQGLPNGGDGWLRIMRFVPDQNQIQVRTYSPLLKEFSDREGDSFSLDCAMGPVDVLDKVRRHIPPLSHERGDRLPILLWQSQRFPTGLETDAVPQTQDVFLKRGLMPLCNPCASVEKAKAYLPVFQYWQQQGFPVCILPQGWMHVLYVPDKNGRFKVGHQAPAESSIEYPCPAATLATPRLAKHAENVSDTLRFLKEQGIQVRLVVIDFESGLFLRHGKEREAAVQAQAEMAARCPKCLEQFSRQSLAGPQAYAALADRVRAEATRRGLCDPAREVFPDIALGNFFAWPINRVPRAEGLWPAYGFEKSGMNVLMPSMYMNAGWRGGGRDQAKMNWNAFYCCLERFSPPASVRRDGELLIPWPHVWLGGNYLHLAMKGRAVPEPWVMAEMARHMMLRGAETFAIWFDALLGDYPADYPFPQYAEMGQLVYDVLGVQAGYNSMLPYHAFLRRARPMTFEVPGKPNELTDQTAAWSGMQTAEKALVRTIAFSGDNATRQIQAFGHKVPLAFGPRGRSYWIDKQGRAEEIAPE